MKPIISVCLLLSSLISSCQVRWAKTYDWTIYAYEGSNQFSVPLDSLKTMDTLLLNQDSIIFYLASSKVKHPKAPLIWMGGYIATCQINGSLRKVELSNYGGYLYDEKTKTYYDVAPEKTENWLSYLQQSFLILARKVSSKQAIPKAN